MTQLRLIFHPTGSETGTVRANAGAIGGGICPPRMTTHCGDDGSISKTHYCTWPAAGQRLASRQRLASGPAGRQEAGKWLASSWGRWQAVAGKWRASGWPTTGERLASGWRATGERPKRAAGERLACSWRVAGEQLVSSSLQQRATARQGNWPVRRGCKRLASS